jgi:hypothetical protein
MVPEKGKPLSKEGLFQLICDEVYKDGVVEVWEEKIVRTMAAVLKLSPSTSQKAVKSSIARYMTDSLGKSRPLSPVSLYTKVLYWSLCDNNLDPLEEQMVLSLRKLFSINDEAHTKVLLKLGVKSDPFTKA